MPINEDGLRQCIKCLRWLTDEKSSFPAIKAGYYKCRICTTEYDRERKGTLLNPRMYNSKGNLTNLGYRILALEHYCGSTVLYCQCCGRPFDWSKLDIDHINNDGAKHRREIADANAKKSGKKEKRKTVATGVEFYRWLWKNNYPPGLQSLCASCNQSKQRLGGVCSCKNPVAIMKKADGETASPFQLSLPFSD